MIEIRYVYGDMGCFMQQKLSSLNFVLLLNFIILFKSYGQAQLRETSYMQNIPPYIPSRITICIYVISIVYSEKYFNSKS